MEIEITQKQANMENEKVNVIIADDDVDYCPPPFFWVCYPDRCVCASPNG